VPETHDQNYPVGSAAVISLNRWLEQVGVTPITAWRWRRKGWLKTVNIAGRQYLTQEAIDEFHRRAVAGEFAQVHKVPSHNGISEHSGGGV
jgi:predicted site-specific integrase-resolvase